MLVSTEYFPAKKCFIEEFPVKCIPKSFALIFKGRDTEKPRKPEFVTKWNIGFLLTEKNTNSLFSNLIDIKKWK